MDNTENACAEANCDYLTGLVKVRKFAHLYIITPTGTVQHAAERHPNAISYTEEESLELYRKFDQAISYFKSSYSRCLEYPLLTQVDAVVIGDIVKRLHAELIVHDKRTPWSKASDTIFYVHQEELGVISDIAKKYEKMISDHYTKMKKEAGEEYQEYYNKKR